MSHFARGWTPSMSLEDTKNLAYWERNMLALLLAKESNSHYRTGNPMFKQPTSGWYEHEGEGFEGWSRVISLYGGTITFHVPDDFDLGDLPKIEPNWNGHSTLEKWNHVQSLCGCDVTP